MKLNLLLLTVAIMHVHASVHSQQITVKGRNIPFKTLIDSIEKQTGYVVFSSKGLLETTQPVTVDVRNMPLKSFLDIIVRHQPLKYFITDKTIGFSAAKQIPSLPIGSIYAIAAEVSGKVSSRKGKPLSPATVEVKNKGLAAVTKEDGSFRIQAEGTDILIVSMIGYKKQEVKINGRAVINIVLEDSITMLSETVLTGIVERKKESFTGATVTISGEELRQVGNQNLVQSLKTLDPSFIVISNNKLGSNPNQLPTIELRGKSSLTQTELRDQFGGDPNQPLFILDGFESDLRTILDLDINRVASVTILKDASSTALYGSRAANGVVVVKTRQPESGALRVNYTNDLRIELPFLRDYNLMNATEKLEFERLSGRYTDKQLDISQRYQPIYDTIYNQRLLRIRQGINTDWLNIPLQTGITQGHSLYAYGGDQQMRYGAGINYRKADGVMKGAGRETWGATVDLVYNKHQLTINNKTYINGYTANESPYGEFSLWSRANPYNAPYDKNGKLLRMLETNPSTMVFGFGDVANPLFNALLNNRNQERKLDIQNNLQLIWKFNKEWQIQGGLQVRKGSGNIDIFVPSEHTSFDQTNVYEKGRYTGTRLDNFSYQANLMLTWAKVFNNKHIITANARGDVEHSKDESNTTIAVGFPAGSNGNPSYAFSYQPNNKPQYNTRVFRRNNALVTVNYSYDSRYLLDLTWRIDGSTAFGSSKKYSPFMSAGIGWNIHREMFFQSSAINVLRLRANIGKTGNQNFGNVSSTSVYAYNRKTNVLGQGVALQQFGNSELEWQSTISANIGTDLVLFNNRVSATVDVYRKITDPLVVIVDLPGSTGISGFATNAGSLHTEGIEATLRVTPFKQASHGLVWNISLFGSLVKSRYQDMGNQLEPLNKKQLEQSSLVRYSDGYSPDDIWTVRSAGIDPATGREIFIRKDGQYTYTYNAADIVKAGNTRPVVEGVFTNAVSWRNFQLGISIRYQFGGDVFNDALYNKVENISESSLGQNQDKRALYDRWKNPGDNARFKAISITDPTPISSRFVQSSNVITGESINLGYQLQDAGWMKKIGLKGIRFNVFMNDIFRISSVKSERGIDYPFANAIASSLNINF